MPSALAHHGDDEARSDHFTPRECNSVFEAVGIDLAVNQLSQPPVSVFQSSAGKLLEGQRLEFRLAVTEEITAAPLVQAICLQC